MIRADSAQFAYEPVGSGHKELITLHDSGHVITVDSEWPIVAGQTRRFTESDLGEMP